MNLVVDVSVLKNALCGGVAGRCCMEFLQDITADNSADRILYEDQWINDWNLALNAPSPNDLKRFQHHWSTLLSGRPKKILVFAGYASAFRDDVLRNGYFNVVSSAEVAIIQNLFYLPEMALSHSADRIVIFHDTGGLQACIIFRDAASDVAHVELQNIKWNSI